VVRTHSEAFVGKVFEGVETSGTDNRCVIQAQALQEFRLKVFIPYVERISAAGIYVYQPTSLFMSALCQKGGNQNHMALVLRRRCRGKAQVILVRN
jgi:hypothetical protein